MTRLKENDIEQIMVEIEEYKRSLIRKTGHSLTRIAAHAVGLTIQDIMEFGRSERIAVVPMTCGQGIIGGFSRTVSGILGSLGMRAFVTSNSDSSGIAEAVEHGADILFMADDDRFVAIHLKMGLVSDNSRATGRGFAAALDLMVGGLKGREILLLGAGPVGRAAAITMSNFGGEIHVFDKNQIRSEQLAKELFERYQKKSKIKTNLDEALNQFKIVFDASPEPEFITREHLSEDSFIAAPGVPCGIQKTALEFISERLIHDPLQLGVATMLFEILQGISVKGRKNSDGNKCCS